MTDHRERITIGLLSENATWHSETVITHGVWEVARDHGINLVYLGIYAVHDEQGAIAHTQLEEGSGLYPTKYDRLRQYIDLFQLDGLLVIGWSKDFHDASDQLLFREAVGDIPVVSLGKAFDPYPCVLVPGYEALKEMTEHLIRQHNRKRIAFIETNNMGDDRTDGYLDAMRSAGLLDDRLLVRYNDLPDDPHHDRLPKAIKLLLDERGLDIDALIVLSSTEGNFALEYLKQQGLRIPDDIALCCYEDNVTTEFSTPPLTTVGFPYEELGKTGTLQLIQLIQGTKVPAVVHVANQVIYRHSCGCSAVTINENHTILFQEFMAREQLNAHLMYMGRNLLSAYDIPKIITYIEHYFGWLQVPYGFIFDRQDNRYRLAFASEQYQHTTDHYDRYIALNTLYNLYKSRKRDPFLLIALPLLHGHEPIGYAWVEPGHQEISTIVTLFEFIKTALKNSALWEESREYIHKLAELADTDGLTGLYNRRFFYQCIHNASKRPDPYSLLFIDIDGFKCVNDTYGHETGDMLLVQIAERIVSELKPYTYTLSLEENQHQQKQTIFRLGGDEFTAMLSEVNKTTLCQLAERLVEAVGAPYNIADNRITISCSIGISLFPENTDDDQMLLRMADTAMYKAKSRKNTYHFA